MHYAVPILLFCATFSFALGITLPLLHVDRLLLFSDEPSLIGIIISLWQNADFLLSIVIALFSIGFPTLKLALVYLVSYTGDTRPRPIPKWLGVLSNWSMLDVMLVALVIFAAKTSGLATAATKPGLWFFAASALLTATTAALAGRLLYKHPERN